MRTFALKPMTTQPTTTAKASSVSRAHVGQGHDPNSILNLQRTMGNQALLRLLQSNTEQRNTFLTGAKSARFWHDFSWIPIHPSSMRAIQTKLQISKPGDEWELEADRIAEQVTRMPEPIVREADVTNPGKEETLRSESTTGQHRTRIPLVSPGSITQQSGGQPLPRSESAFFELRFGADFSQVRIHKDSRAAEMAQSLEARAFTAGRDIFFAAGQYSTETAVGRQLLAHELAHVAQQTVVSDPNMEKYLASQLLRAPTGCVQRSGVEDLVDTAQEIALRTWYQIREQIPSAYFEWGFRYVHGADNPLSIRFLRNYMAGERTPITLTESEMRECQPRFGIESHFDGYSRNDRSPNPRFNRKLEELISSGAESIPISDIRSLGFAPLRGTLGAFTVHWNGSLRFERRESSRIVWNFVGEVSFTDTWDLNPGNRRRDVERDVRIGNLLIPGRPFQIDSVRVHAEQTGTIGDAYEPTW